MPDATGYLTVDIAVASANERLLGDSLAMKGDEACGASG